MTFLCGRNFVLETEQKPKIFVDSFYTFQDTFPEDVPNSERNTTSEFGKSSENDSALCLYIQHTVDT